MAWTIDISAKVAKYLKKLDKPAAAKIYGCLQEIEQLSDPRQKGKALTGNLSGLWRYRVEDYRIICSIENNELIVLVVDIGHRKAIYR